jgi:hypothetical protein
MSTPPGAEQERGGKAAPVGDAARRRHHGRGRAPGHDVGDLRHKWQGRVIAAMSARLAALRDDDIGADRQRVVDMGERRHLAEEERARRLDLGGEGSRVAERQHQCRRPMGEREIEQLGPPGQRPGDEAAADAMVPGGSEFAIEPIRVAVAAADEAEPTRRAEGAASAPPETLPVGASSTGGCSMPRRSVRRVLSGMRGLRMWQCRR